MAHDDGKTDRAPEYRSLGKLLGDPQTGHLRFSPEETAAVRVVNEVMSLRGG